ncbi:hypothetical protein SAMN05216320_115113 [Duganella sp. OV458]|nr:hypothetical protein SAMN05216320_115113 [Duganella sp. OV458]SDK66826.1 hypothetical protein SAMN05428973_11515 [Duganella sp. OV510]
MEKRAAIKSQVMATWEISNEIFKPFVLNSTRKFPNWKEAFIAV